MLAVLNPIVGGHPTKYEDFKNNNKQMEPKR